VVVVGAGARARGTAAAFLSQTRSLSSLSSTLQTLRINPAKTDIDSFTFDDFELVGYEPAKKIAMQMAV